MNDHPKLIPTAVVCQRAGIEPRLLTKFVSLGLAASSGPTKHGRGKGGGRGSKAGRTENQVRLITEVAKRRAEGTRFPELCNLPVGLWLYFDDSAVPVEQVLRALKTWAKAALSRANKTTRIVTSAKRLGAMLASPAYDAAEREWRKREIDCFVNVEKTTPLDDHETHEKALADVIDTFNTAPQGGNRRRIHAGPAELPIVPRNIILGRRAMLVAIENIDRFQAADLDLARHLILMDLREYLREQPRLAELSDAAAFYTSVTMAELLEGACGDLTRILGHAMLCPTRVREVLESSATHNSGPLRLRVKSLTGSLELDER